MGQNRTYKCNLCGYSVLTSAGHDVGMMAVTDTYTCTSCNEIVDVLIGEMGQVYPRDKIAELVSDITERSEFYTCPECDSGGHLVKWDLNKRPCPKCGSKMDEDSMGENMMWD